MRSPAEISTIMPSVESSTRMEYSKIRREESARYSAESTSVATEPIRLRELTAEALAAAIERALGDDEMHRAAAAMRDRVRDEGGAAGAVAVLERTLGGRNA